MRIYFVGILLLTVFLAWVGELFIQDPGYVMISYGHYVIETSLWLPVVGFVLALVAILLLWEAGRRMIRTPTSMRRWLAQRGIKSARRKTILGLIELAEGRWEKAERLLIKSALHTDYPLVNYLNAARAADELGDSERRDRYLKEALATKIGHPELAVGLTQAQLQLSQRQWEQCHATLQRLKKIAPDNEYILKLLVPVHQKLGNWQALVELLPQIDKANLFNLEHYEKLQQSIYRQWLKATVQAIKHRSSSIDELFTVWEKIPKNAKRPSEIQQIYVDALLELGAVEEANSFLQQSLCTHWDEALIQRYGLLAIQDIQPLIKIAEQWLKEYPGDAALLLALGRLSLRSHDIEKASAYLEASLAVRHTSEACYELACLFAQQGKYQQAVTLFEEAALGA